MGGEWNLGLVEYKFREDVTEKIVSNLDPKKVKESSSVSRN